MSRTKGNGLDAANDQPAEKQTKDATHFIAGAVRLASTDAGLCLLCVVLLIQAVLLALGVLS